VSKHPTRNASQRFQSGRWRSLAAVGIVSLAIALGAIVLKVAASHGTSSASAGPTLAADRPLAPAFSLAGLGGATVSLSSLRGKTVVLGFVQPDCTSCIGTLQTLSAVASHLSRSRVAIVAVNVNTYTTAADLASFARQIGVTSGPRFTLDHGDQTARAYHVQTLETEIVIDPTGHVVLRGVALPASALVSAVQQAT
jgi:thiol-disulfide isomerase/thioredoxin